MPTNHDETLHERYAREHQAELEIYARMTPEQISEMANDLNNALAQRDAAIAELAESDQALRESRANDMESMRQLAEARAELAALKGGQAKPQLIIGSTYASTRGFGRLLYLGETHDIDGWLHTFRATDGARKHYRYDQLPDVLEEFAAPPAQASAWVAVSERLPDEIRADYLIFYSGSGQVCMSEWIKDSTEGWCFWHGDPTHWQPLPAAPTPGASDGEDGE